MKKLLAVLLIASLSGCASWFDFDGNGRFDPVAYLEDADIAVSWVDAQGTPFMIAVNEDGVQMAGVFVSPKTGRRYVLTEEGGFVITDPSGVEVRIGPSQ